MRTLAEFRCLLTSFVLAMVIVAGSGYNREGCADDSRGSVTDLGARSNPLNAICGLKAGVSVRKAPTPSSPDLVGRNEDRVLPPPHFSLLLFRAFRNEAPEHLEIVCASGRAPPRWG